MAYTTQMHFLRVQFPHEMLSNLLADNAKFTTKSYEACSDVRSWSLNKNERAQYLLELISATGNVQQQPQQQPTLPKPEDHPDHPDHPDNKLKTACMSNDQLKKQIKDLQEQVASLLCQLECSQSCQADIEILTKECTKWKCDAEDLKCKLKQTTESCACTTKEKENLKKQLREACEKAKAEYDELQKKYQELECKCHEQQECPKDSNDLVLLCEENTELKRNLKESCKKITSLQHEISCAEKKCRHTQHKASSKDDELEKMDKLICELEQKLKEIEQENCDLQEQISNNDHLKVAQTEICLLAKENKALCEQLDQCQQRDSTNDSDKEDYERIKMERDILKSKFTELQPDLEELANVVEEHTELENNYNAIVAELDTYKDQVAQMMDRLKMLMYMEKEFKILQKRVCESERLLNEYQVLQKLECLRGGYRGDQMDDQEDYSQASSQCTPSSEYSETDDYDSDTNGNANEQIPNRDSEYCSEDDGV